ncbi:hypothetical protein [Streptomyces sp. CoT10]|uniref:hypothetical protein n=1 Tax=Streptomyces sp. CoT10 TaxID=2875762 RepID=UPI001CD25379|nr:hypothetical protein [Streptomyces sp. CoT10]
MPGVALGCLVWQNPRAVSVVQAPWEPITAALDAGIGASWATGDEAYCQGPALRALLESRRTGYVLAVARSTRVRINQGHTAVRADAVADHLPASAWHRPPEPARRGRATTTGPGSRSIPTATGTC